MLQKSPKYFNNKQKGIPNSPVIHLNFTIRTIIMKSKVKTRRKRNKRKQNSKSKSALKILRKFYEKNK